MMKNTTVKYCIARVLAGSAVMLVFCLGTTGHADVYNLTVSQLSPQHWNSLGTWTNTVGGANPTTILPTDDYDMDGFTLRSPTDESPVFGGKSLTTSGGAILFKHTGTATITNFNDVGGTRLIVGNAAVTQGVHLVGFSLAGYTQLSAAPDRGVDLQIDGWVGSATLRTGAATSDLGYYGLTVTDASGFTGKIWSTFGTTDWKNDADLSNAEYEIITAGYEDVILDSDITVGSLLIGSTAYAPGTYSFATLNAAHDSSFIDGGTGSITVLGFSESYKLTGDQGTSQHWNSLGTWTNTVGGANPVAILPIDDFDLDGFTLRSPTSASPVFGGKSLMASGGAILFKHTGAATITNFNAVGGTKLIVGNASVTQGVHLVGFSLTGYTQLGAVSGRGIDLQVDGWTGDATLRTGDSTSALGYYGLTVTDALGFNGKIQSTFGTTDWKNDADISSATYEIITAGYEHVVLNRDIRVGVLTIGSTTYPTGTYSFATLNAAHDSSFVEGGTGSIAVGLGPAPSAPPYTLWASQYPSMGSETNHTDDPDSDGLVNLYEWGLGGDPTNGADTGHVPTFGMIEEGGTNWFEYIHAKRNDADALGLAYHLELNTDLVYGNWSNGNYAVVGIGTLDSEFDAITNHVPADIENKQFIQLVIESN